MILKHFPLKLRLLEFFNTVFTARATRLQLAKALWTWILFLQKISSPERNMYRKLFSSVSNFPSSSITELLNMKIFVESMLHYEQSKRYLFPDTPSSRSKNIFFQSFKNYGHSIFFYDLPFGLAKCNIFPHDFKVHIVRLQRHCVFFHAELDMAVPLWSTATFVAIGTFIYCAKFVDSIQNENKWFSCSRVMRTLPMSCFSSFALEIRGLSK